tara:strand:+ start:1609 stop:2331 length:723 start_codon:yes stop_codon:yes gene_type:complete
MTSISILIPIYKRNKFKNLIIYNLNNLKYDQTLLEVVILDDAPEEDLFLKNQEEILNFQKEIQPIKLNYIIDKTGRKTIGYKRNKLVKNAKFNICAYMDSDDLYHEEYLKYSLKIMKEGKFNIVGSNQMLFVYPTNDIFENWITTGIKCEAKRMIHEATMVFNKKYFKAMGGFENSSKGEGTKMLDGMNTDKIGLTDIQNVMFCICHSDNTINKDFFKDKNIVDVSFDLKDKYKIVNALF